MAPQAQGTPPDGPQQDAPDARTPQAPLPREHGGRGGLEPTRYGDWEKGGRCIDF